MSQPIPIDVIPAHVYLSQHDQVALFGLGHPMTIAAEHTQSGQYVYEETVEVFGALKRSLEVRVLGPNWRYSLVEITPVEAAYLGLKLSEARPGEREAMGACRIVGPKGEISLERGIIIPKPNLRLSPDDAKALHITNGQEVSLEIAGERTQVLHDVVARVHPTYRLRVEVHADHARKLWLARLAHARLRE